MRSLKFLLTIAVCGSALAQQQASAPFNSASISGLGARNIGSAAMSGRISAIAGAHEPFVGGLAHQFVEPVVVAEADTHQEAGVADFLEIARPRLEGFGIDGGRYDCLDRNEIAADGGCNRGKIRGGGDDAQLRLCRRSKAERPRQQDGEARCPRYQRDDTHVLFGTRQCTAFSAPAGAAGRQSMIMLASA